MRPGAKVIGIGGVDVRKFDGLNDAADRCASELGGIDFVVAGAAGNFLASINQLSVNAFKAVMDIDVLGSYNTFKATAPYLVESAEKYRVDSETRMFVSFFFFFFFFFFLAQIDEFSRQTLPRRHRG